MIIQSCSVYISIYTYSHKTQQLYIISSDIQYATTCFGPVCRPSSGCLENLSNYTVCVALHTGPKHVVAYYISLLIIYNFCVSWLYVCICRYIHTTTLCYWPNTTGMPHLMGNIWYSVDRASQYIYLNINQLNALNFIMSLFHASTCFEHHVLIVRRSKLYYTTSGIITLKQVSGLKLLK